VSLRDIRHLVSIHARIRSGDGLGGASSDWIRVDDQWAGVTHLSSMRAEDGAREPLRRIAVSVRNRSTIRLGRRVRFEDADFDIVSIETAGPRDDRYLRLICEEARL
jgi:head-tail adaptor